MSDLANPPAAPDAEIRSSLDAAAPALAQSSAPVPSADKADGRAEPSNVVQLPLEDTGGAKTHALVPTVSKLKVGDLDERGNTVKYIYAVDPDYIVYYSRLELRGDRSTEAPDRLLTEAGERRGRLARLASLFRPRTDQGYEREGVHVQLSNEPAKRKQQQGKLLPLGTVRAKLQALLSGWPRRESYDSSVATALQQALDGNGDGMAKEALSTLDDAQSAIKSEREIAGRVQYASAAVTASVVLFALLQIAKHNAFHHSDTFWLGAQAGLIGAIGSIAFGIRSRAVALDTNYKGNLCDSVLRLVIGAISGGALVLLFATGLMPKLETAYGPLEIMSVPVVLLLGIVAGFVEKLVPSMLEQESGKLGGSGAGAGTPAKAHPGAS